MKPSTLDIIKKAYDICKDSFDCDVCEKAAELLLSVIRAETCGKTNSKSKFNLFEFVANDPLRPVMNGIYHDKGFKVASDSKVLAVLKEDYEDDLEGKAISKTGEEIEGRYPRYDKVLPQYNKDEYTSYTIDFESFYNQLKELRTKVYQDTGKKKTWVNEMVVKVGDTWLSAQNFEKIIHFMQHIGTELVHIKDKEHAVLIFNGESKAIIMPRAPYDYEKNPNDYYVIYL